VLLVDNRETDILQADANDVVTFTCNLYKTRPAPIFTWFKVHESGMAKRIDDAVVSGENPSGDDLFDYYSNLTLRMLADDNSWSIRCEVNHTMLGEENNHDDVRLDITGNRTNRN
jgi:hypothetical protein